jgi:adenylosuccinate synthase
MTIEPMWTPYGEYLNQTPSWIVYNETQSITDILTAKTNYSNYQIAKKIVDFFEEEKDTIKHLSEYQMLVVMWTFLWDEWKWTDGYKLALELLDDGWLVISSIGWPNAGHKVVLPNWEIFIWHNLPGAAATWKKTFLSQWKFINAAGLKNEIIDLSKLKYTEWKSNIVIAKNAQCIFSSFHAKLDWMIENSKTWNKKTGTTGSWMWPVNATEALRTWITIEELTTLTERGLRNKVDILIWVFKEENKELDLDWIDTSQVKKEMLEHRNVLKELINYNKVKLVDDDYAQKAYQEWRKSILEWSQSINLWKHAIWQDWEARYPYVTSWDTSFTWNLTPLWLTPEEWRIWIVAVFKMIMSAIWNHPDFLSKVAALYPEFKDYIEKFAEETWEKWETTWRPRDLGFTDLTILENYITTHYQHTAWVVLRKMDVYEKFMADLKIPLDKQFPWREGKIPMIRAYKEDWTPEFIFVEQDTNAIMKVVIETFDNALKDQKHSKHDKFNKPIAGWFWPWTKDTYVMDPNDFRK